MKTAMHLKLVFLFLMIFTVLSVFGQTNPNKPIKLMDEVPQKHWNFLNNLEGFSIQQGALMIQKGYVPRLNKLGEVELVRLIDQPANSNNNNVPAREIITITAPGDVVLTMVCACPGETEDDCGFVVENRTNEYRCQGGTCCKTLTTVAVDGEVIIMEAP